MRRADFEQLVRDLAAQVPAEFTAGIEAIEVTPRTLPHPVHADVFTLGECVPHAFDGPGEPGSQLRSTILLHHGSFAALARISADFDWRREAWETLTHELRHHLEWRSRVPDLERLDDAVDANYARQAGEPFPPLFFLGGETLAPGVSFSTNAAVAGTRPAKNLMARSMTSGGASDVVVSNVMGLPQDPACSSLCHSRH